MPDGVGTYNNVESILTRATQYCTIKNYKTFFSFEHSLFIYSTA